MGLIGDVSKGLLIFAVGFWVYLIIQLIVTGQIVFAALFLVGLMIPIVYVTLDYRSNFREFQCRKCQHHFKVSYLTLVFTRKSQGSAHAPTGTAAYNLECPKCYAKAWLVPQE
ncbi:MAG: hypothetical protein CW716_13035 [Candidatus Bathyarchaeum sp.]|nr:MAG: hypothetical protein CW716_13035 [Candidatus Bathyarchaeum sp.]